MTLLLRRVSAVTCFFRHLKGHYEGIANIDTENMSEAEMEFHYFK